MSLSTVPRVKKKRKSRHHPPFAPAHLSLAFVYIIRIYIVFESYRLR